MSSLTRTRQGDFTADKAVRLQDVDHSNYKLLTLEDLFSYPYYELSGEEYRKVSNGAPLQLVKNNPFLFMQYEKRIVAIYERKESSYVSSFQL